MSVALLAVFVTAWLNPSFGLEGGPLVPGRVELRRCFRYFPDSGMEIEFGSPEGSLGRLADPVFSSFFHLRRSYLVVLGIRRLDSSTRFGLDSFSRHLAYTISSCVVYTRLAGNDGGCGSWSRNLFQFVRDAMGSSRRFLGAFGGFDSRGSEDGLSASFELLPDFLLMIFLPVLIGWWGKNKLPGGFLPENASWLEQIPIGCILLLAYFSFCSLFAEFGNELFGPSAGILAAVVLVLLLIVTVLAWALGGFVSHSRKARVTFFFCGSQKSLALGLPLAQMLFVFDENSVGLLVCLSPCFTLVNSFSEPF